MLKRLAQQFSLQSCFQGFNIIVYGNKAYKNKGTKAESTPYEYDFIFIKYAYSFLNSIAVSVRYYVRLSLEIKKKDYTANLKKVQT